MRACHAAHAPAPLPGPQSAFYTTLANFTQTVTTGTGAGQPYINPCSTNPTLSEFVCNTQSTGPCGLAGMPLGTPIADAGAITTWVACGAP